MNYKIILSTIRNESALWFSGSLHQIIQISLYLRIAGVLQNWKQRTKRNPIFMFFYPRILPQKIHKCMPFCWRRNQTQRLCHFVNHVKRKSAWRSWWWVCTKFCHGCLKLQKKFEEELNGRACYWKDFNCESIKNILSKWYWGYRILHLNDKGLFIPRTANHWSLFPDLQWSWIAIKV